MSARRRRGAPDGEAEGERKPRRSSETVKALAGAVLLALAIRSFVVEPFKIPSGSMIPTLLVGDYIVVNKFSYGVRLPIWGTLLLPMGEPERGDVIVFRYPDDPSTDYIKRVVGLPGDRVEIREGRLFLNGQVVDRMDRGKFSYYDYQRADDTTARCYREINPSGVEYSILQNPGMRRSPRKLWVVPEGHYFMMGDNRDNSRDSRMWRNPYVAAHQIKGRAMVIHWSWVVSSSPGRERGFVEDLFHTLWRVLTFQVETFRWERIGRPVSKLAC